MKNRGKQMMAVFLAAAITGTGAGSAMFGESDSINGPLTVYGAPASVAVDETMYVNLDYYGKAARVNVVKGCSLNGLTTFTDYGQYSNVENMTGDEVPVMGDGQLTWQLPDSQKGRFYYKCTLENDQVVLPWDFDVSYKLNGVPTDGEKLAGASGLVEIEVKATPNENAELYYCNNMLLMVSVPVDLSKCYSVEAENSQTQNMGDTTAVVFTALPGEEGDYSVRIGTDSFETTGVIMAMVPGTVEDLKHIKDLKEAKDTWQSAGDDLYESLDEMAKSVEAMRGGVNQVQSGLSSAESARQKWSGSKDSILAGNDQTLAALTAMSKQMETLVPHLQTAKDEADVVHRSMNDIVNTLGDMQEPLRKLYTRLNDIKSGTEAVAGQLPDLRSDMEFLIQTDASFQVQTGTALEQIEQLLAALEAAGIDYSDFVVENAEEDVEENVSGRVVDAPDTSDVSDSTKAPDTSDVSDSSKAPDIPASGNPGSAKEPERSDSSDTANGTDAPAQEAAPDTSSTPNQTESPDSTPASGSSDASASSEILSRAAGARIEKNTVPMVGATQRGQTDLAGMMQMLKKISEDSKSATATMSNLMDNVSDSAKYSAELVDNMDYLIEDITALNDTLDTYYPDLQSALEDTEQLVNRTTEALNSGIGTMTIVQNTLKDSSGDLDASARESLRGSMELLDKSLSILDSTAGMRKSSRTMKDVMDNELNKFDTDNRFLFMDPTAEKVSFTSKQNAAPRTLQIVLRTDEISPDDELHDVMDAETQKVQASPLKRMWNVLVKMWQALVDIFKNR